MLLKRVTSNQEWECRKEIYCCLAYFRLNWYCVKYSLVRSYSKALRSVWEVRERLFCVAMENLFINCRDRKFSLKTDFFYQQMLIAGVWNTSWWHVNRTQHLHHINCSLPLPLTGYYYSCSNNLPCSSEPHDDFVFHPSIQTLSLCWKSVVLFLSPNRSGWDFTSSFLTFPTWSFELIFVWKARSGWKIQFTVIVTFVSREGEGKRFFFEEEKKVFTSRFPQIHIRNDDATCENSYTNFWHL